MPPTLMDARASNEEVTECHCLLLALFTALRDLPCHANPAYPWVWAVAASAQPSCFFDREGLHHMLNGDNVGICEPIYLSRTFINAKIVV